MNPNTPDTFCNPILPGGYPDPSICRVGQDYYLANSSFEYFPGLPIHHSRDLVNWQLVGYGLQRPEQCTGAVNLLDVQTMGGIHAPSLRFHDGRFYIITTNVYLPPENAWPQAESVNFIITADQVEGPWSQPQVIEGAPGIDPDLFFDDDGKVWYVGTHQPVEPRFPGEGEIWLQELDPAGWQLTGPRHFLWRGACGGTWAEGPHLYRRDGRYYLLIAEGGTSLNHAVMVAVSDTITGPYHANPRNPILSSRHLSYDYWVNSVGHADLVELPDGRWYAVALGIRNELGHYSNMGRETHLVPVTWEREPFEWQEIKYEWPVCAPFSGRVERYNPLPFAGKRQEQAPVFQDDFESPELNLAWNFRRLPLPETYSLTARPGYLRLFARPEILRERGRCSFVGFRQTESDFEYTAAMQFQPASAGQEAGIVLLQRDDNYLRFTLNWENQQAVLKLLLAEMGSDPVAIKRCVLNGYRGEIVLKVSSQQQRYHYAYSLDGGQHFVGCAETSAGHILGRGYTGAYLGLYASSNGQNSDAYADFAWVRCQNLGCHPEYSP